MTKFFLAAWHLVYHLGKNQQRQNALELDYYFLCHCEFVKSGIIVYSNECGFFIRTCYLITFRLSYEIDDSCMSVVAFLNANYINVCDTCVAISNELY